MMVSWLFQANPKYSQILAAIQKREGIYWLVTRYTEEITPGDRVIIWIAGKQAGIYATAEVTAAPAFRDEPPDIDIWTIPVRAKARVWALVRFQQRLLDAPLLKSVLVFDPILHDLEVIRRPHNSNFRVSEEQWRRVLSLLNGE